MTADHTVICSGCDGRMSPRFIAAKSPDFVFCASCRDATARGKPFANRSGLLRLEGDGSAWQAPGASDYGEIAEELMAASLAATPYLNELADMAADQMSDESLNHRSVDEATAAAAYQLAEILFDRGVVDWAPDGRGLAFVDRTAPVLDLPELSEAVELLTIGEVDTALEVLKKAKRRHGLR